MFRSQPAVCRLENAVCIRAARVALGSSSRGGHQEPFRNADPDPSPGPPRHGLHRGGPRRLAGLRPVSGTGLEPPMAVASPAARHCALSWLGGQQALPLPQGATPAGVRPRISPGHAHSAWRTGKQTTHSTPRLHAPQRRSRVPRVEPERSCPLTLSGPCLPPGTLIYLHVAVPALAMSPSSCLSRGELIPAHSLRPVRDFTLRLCRAHALASGVHSRHRLGLPVLSPPSLQLLPPVGTFSVLYSSSWQFPQHRILCCFLADPFSPPLRF